jgi:hypothetical protein
MTPPLQKKKNNKNKKLDAKLSMKAIDKICPSTIDIIRKLNEYKYILNK